MQNWSVPQYLWPLWNMKRWEGGKPLLLFVGRRLPLMINLKCGEMDCKQDLSLSLMNASKVYLRLTKSDFREPANIGSDEMVNMNEMAGIVLSFENKKLPIRHIPGPEGVRGRNSDNTLIKEKLGWAPTMRLKNKSRRRSFMVLISLFMDRRRWWELRHLFTSDRFMLLMTKNEMPMIQLRSGCNQIKLTRKPARTRLVNRLDESTSNKISSYSLNNTSLDS
ncbi:uncharacterized protein LOC110103266 isoform X2 [Dendrobium catenatum]|uniref:uncharacterized protein LOC110103266 isoform X2 n=1 Tax=Dendrobium catenatum TaxID=906689 RepID=UPI00109F40F8|nr:uncharacterized protein LOC110103266 isoform X2 [Dendrobium catenatum]